MARKLAAIFFLIPLVLTLASCEKHEKKSSEEKRVEREEIPADGDN